MITIIADAGAETGAAAAITTWPALIAFLATMLVPHAITYVQGRRVKKLAAQAAADAAQTREQTVNNHENHPTPNLREQMDAQDARLASIEAGIGELAAAHREHVASDEAWKTSVERDLARRRPFFSWRY